MRNLTCGDQQISLLVYGRGLKLRKLVTKDWIHVSPGLVSGDRGVGGCWNFMYFFGGFC